MPPEVRLFAEGDLATEQKTAVEHLTQLDDQEFDRQTLRYIERVDAGKPVFRSERLAQRTLDSLQRNRGTIQNALATFGKPRNDSDLQKRKSLENLSGRLRTEIKILQSLLAEAKPEGQPDPREQGLRSRAAWVVAYGLHRQEHATARRLLRDERLSVDRAIVALRAIVLDGVPYDQAVESVRPPAQKK